MSSAIGQMHPARAIGSYCAALDAGLPQKLRAIEPWVHAWHGGEILDLGAGTGALAARQAHRHPHARVIGVDAAPAMVTRSRRRHGGYRNLHLRTGDASEVHSRSAACVILCSVLHEVYSYAGDSMAAVRAVLAACWKSLLPGGRLIVRDFVKPLDAARPALLCHQRHDIVPGHDFLSFSRAFGRPVLVRSVRASPATMVYETDAVSAHEYLLRKDYHEMWDAELHEHYAFWTMADARALVRAAGFAIVHSELLHSRWAIESAFRGKVELRDPDTWQPIRPSPAQLLLVAEKP